MLKKFDWKSAIFVALILAVSVASRLLPHLPNMSIITAIGIFAASVMPWKRALVLVFAVRLLSDFALGFFEIPLMLAVYTSHAFGVVLGRYVGMAKSAGSKWNRIIFSGFFSAIVFFLVTNFALFYEIYPNTLEGIMSSYVNALPFLKGTIVGDVGYSVVFFGCMEAVMFLRKKNLFSQFKLKWKKYTV